MATENKYVNLSSKTADFDSMMSNGFGIVTVMNAKVYNSQYSGTEDTKLTPKEVIEKYAGNEICELKTLKVANVTQEGPNKTVTGGQYSNPLIKFGKSARLEMQDALGNAKAIEALGGATIGYQADKSTISALHFGEEFSGPKTIIGDSFFIDQQSGRQIPVNIIFYNFLPDSIFNLTQDAEGDATVFDMNGDLMTTTVELEDFAGNKINSGLFYSIVAKEAQVNAFTTKVGTDGKMTLTAESGYTVTVDGSDSLEIAKDTAARVVAKKGTTVVYDKVIKNY
jgi:hypothetical protein